MSQDSPRPWLPTAAQARIDELSATFGSELSPQSANQLAARVEALADQNRRIHNRDCFNLNPATNRMNPRAEALLASELGVRPSLGYPGAKYETGLEAIEEIEVITSHLASALFAARYVEFRVASGAMANLYAFMATCQPGDAIIAPPASIAGHVTHQSAGCAGLYGLKIHAAPIAADRYSVDLDGLRQLALRVGPRLITIGQSLNLWPHPIAELRAIADEVGARLLFDAAHQCGMIAGGQFPNPLDQGADLMTMSTYKSLGGPAAGLVLTNDPVLAQRIEAIAYPGLTANFDVAKTAALAITLADWLTHGPAYAACMVESAQALALALEDRGLPLFRTRNGISASHQFAVQAERWGGGQAASAQLRDAGLLACGIGLPLAEVPGDVNGLRLGTPELCRIGLSASDMPRLADYLQAALRADSGTVRRERIAPEVARWRQEFSALHFITA